MSNPSTPVMKIKKAKFPYNGGEYDGDYIGNNSPHGVGALKYSNGDAYVGEWRLGQCQGKGNLTLADGTIYKGDFHNDAINGSGIITFPNKDTYDGFFVDGIFHGVGKYTFANGQYYQGSWVDGMRHGQGIYVCDNVRYEGAWRHDQRHGRGTEISKNTKFEGFWCDGKRVGTGFFDLKKKTMGFNVQTYENGVVKEEKLQDEAPVLTTPSELSFISDEKEEHELSSCSLTQEDADLIKILVESVLLRKIATWSRLAHAFAKYYRTKLDLEVVITKVMRLTEIHENTCDKGMLEEKIKTLDAISENKEKMLEAFERYGFKTELSMDASMDIVRMKYFVILGQFKSDLMKMNLDIDEAKKLGDVNLLKAKETELEDLFANDKDDLGIVIRSLMSSVTCKVDKNVSIYLEMYKAIEGYFGKLLRIKKKHVKVLQDVQNWKELMVDVQLCYEKNFSTFEGLVTTSGGNWSKTLVDMDLLVNKIHVLNTKMRK